MTPAALADPALTLTVEERRVYVPPRPMTFAEFLDRCGEDDDVELIDGVIVERMAAQLDHERLFAWLITVLTSFVSERDLGTVLGSRSAVEIASHHGRLPDLLFVRKERENIIEQRAVYDAPDLILELVSPNDRPSDIVALETDYGSIGVEQVAFIGLQRQRVRVLTRPADGSDYEEAEVTSGPLAFAALPGLTLQAEWLWADDRPTQFSILAPLLSPPSD